MADTRPDATDAFIARWQGVTASELSTSQSLLSDLCRLLGVDTPHPDAERAYMFERPITFAHGDGSSSAGRIDLYKQARRVRPRIQEAQGHHPQHLISAASPEGLSVVGCDEPLANRSFAIDAVRYAYRILRRCEPCIVMLL